MDRKRADSALRRVHEKLTHGRALTEYKYDAYVTLPMRWLEDLYRDLAAGLDGSGDTADADAVKAVAARIDGLRATDLDGNPVASVVTSEDLGRLAASLRRAVSRPAADAPAGGRGGE